MLVSMLVLFLRRRFIPSQMPGDRSLGLETKDSDVMFSINTGGKERIMVVNIKTISSVKKPMKRYFKGTWINYG